MEYQHRFSKGQEDLGLYKNNPFEIKLKEDAKTQLFRVAIGTIQW